MIEQVNLPITTLLDRGVYGARTMTARRGTPIAALP